MLGRKIRICTTSLGYHLICLVLSMEPPPEILIVLEGTLGLLHFTVGSSLYIDHVRRIILDLGKKPSAKGIQQITIKHTGID